MTGLIPWKKKQIKASGNGGAPTLAFPTFMRRMQTEFDELFDRYARNWPMSFNDLGNGWRWGLDVEDDEDRVTIRAEAPGFEAGDFDIELHDNRLVLRATRKTHTKEKGGEVREQHECYESMTLPDGVDKDKIDARYHNGVLTLTIPKTPDGKAKRITVKAN